MLCHCSRGQNRAVDQPLQYIHVHLSRGLLHPNHTHVYTRVTPVLLLTYQVYHPWHTCVTSMLPYMLHPRYHMCYIHVTTYVTSTLHMCYIGASQTHYPMCGHVRYMYMRALILHAPLAEFKMTSSLFFGVNPCMFRNPIVP